jgi:hypothetical protein
MWLRTDTRQSFLLTVRKYDGQVPKRDRMWLSGCIAALKDHCGLSLERVKQARSHASIRTPNRVLIRRRIQQGPPFKCPLLRELLFDWFVDIRRSLATTISPKFVLMKARQLADVIVETQKELGAFEAMPLIDTNWLLRFKRDKNIVFRRPNARYKCSRPVLLARMKAMWCNILRVRRFAEVSFGNDLRQSIYGIDEKPIHFNESGSKNSYTLEMLGAPSVKLKQNHAATRERVSIMTCVSSSEAAASQLRKLPVEALFKAKSEKRTRNLKTPKDMNFSLQWAEKGSYRLEHIIRFLDRWLDPWTPARAEAHDYRILMLDVAGSHCGDEVVDFGWGRGYFVLYHYGCTTGVAQVNDTDLHGQFEKVYTEMEQMSFNEVQLLRPGCINRSPQDVIDDVAGTWATLDHSQAVAGHKRTGLSCALDGSEDYLITREALECWLTLGMPAIRRQILAEVDEGVASGLFSLAKWKDLVQHPEDPGVLVDEGMEFEGDLDGSSWLDEEAAKEIEADDAAVLKPAEDPAQPTVEALPGDSAGALVEADASAKRLVLLKRLRDDAKAAGVPGAYFTLDKEVSQLERGRKTKSKAGGEAQQILRRHVAAKQEEAHKDLMQRRAEAQAADREIKKARLLVAQANQAKTAASKAKAELKKKLDELPIVISANDCGEPGLKGLQARVNCLERLQLRSPPLSFAQRARWTAIRDGYARRLAKVHKEKTVGVVFIGKINGVLKALGDKYKGESKFNKKKDCGGDAKAFASFFKEMENSIPKAASTVEM